MKKPTELCQILHATLKPLEELLAARDDIHVCDMSINSWGGIQIMLVDMNRADFYRLEADLNGLGMHMTISKHGKTHANFKVLGGDVVVVAILTDGEKA